MMLNQSEDPETIRELMTRGTYNVSIIEAMPRLATDMVKGMRWTVIKHLKTMGVGIHMNTSVKEITADGIRIIKEGREELIKADTVVIAIGSRSEQALYEELKENLDNVILLGDAVQPGKVMDAIHSAFTIVNDL
jgi:2,4-dienoyl-CoA reductase (NADPH2)